jgi:nitrite reductase/ring-hydroxylating ferredoxin subunit
VRRFPFERLPYGWFLVATSAELPRGGTLTLRYFGEELVLFRGEDGRAHCLEAHCPHLGAHLGEGGCVVENTLSCPFHGWRFAGDGRCVAVPYSDKVPRVGVRAWPVDERGGFLFLWHDEDGTGPTFQLPAVDDEAWTPTRITTWTLRSHPQELMENTADIAHFGHLHGAKNHRYLRDWASDGPFADTLIGFQASGAAVGAPEAWIDLEINFALHGLGYLVIDSRAEAVGLEGRVRVCPTPIDDEHVQVFFLTNVRKMPDPGMTAMIDELFTQATRADFEQDLKIWKHKVYRARPVVVPGDGPILQYRRWASQFYAPLSAAG